MFNNAKNLTITVEGKHIDYISFGKGKKNLILIAGVGDGLKTVKGMAVPFSSMYKKFTKDFTVYSFSRSIEMGPNYSTKDMAQEIAGALKQLNISKASVLGVSEGGMIAQHLAIDNPELVEKLILTVTIPKQNDVIQKVANQWVKWAEEGNYKEIFVDTMEKSYTEKKLKQYRRFYKMMAVFTKPKNLNRFLIQVKACLTHHTFENLGKIKCSTLVIGGEKDKILGSEGSLDLAQNIPNSTLFMYKDLGHGLYDEAKDFNDKALDFLISG